MKKTYFLLFSIITILCIGSWNPFSCTMNITGRVSFEYLEDLPAAGLTVTASPGAYTAVTDAEGAYGFEALPKETYMLTVSTYGYNGSKMVFVEEEIFSCSGSSSTVADIEILVDYVPEASDTDSFITGYQVVYDSPPMIVDSVGFEIVLSTSVNLAIDITDVYMHKRVTGWGEWLESGLNYVTWDQRDDEGVLLEAGEYRYYLIATRDGLKQVEGGYFTIVPD